MRAEAWLFSVVALAACGGRGGERPLADGSSAASAPGAPTQAPFAGKPTAALVHRPEVAALVDAMAKAGRMESAGIGAAGSPSEVHATFTKLAKLATPEELLALSAHESPAVRAYVGEHLATHGAAGHPALVALAEDTSRLETQSGCNVITRSVGSVVVDALCEASADDATAALFAIHEASGHQAARALACVAPLAPDRAAPAAVKALRASPRPLERAEYLSVFAAAPVPEACELGRAGAGSGDASVEIAAAKALWRCDDEASRRVLAALAAGKNVVVARHARASQFFLSPAERPALILDREVKSDVLSRLRELLRSAPGTKAFLPLVDELVAAHPGALGGALEAARVLPETTALALRIAARHAPQKNGDKRPDRTSALRYLARARDRAALPELRRSLDCDDPVEVRAALAGLVALGDAPSKPAVEKLAKHPLIEIARAAREAAPKL